ncbi:radical SAM protein [Candidatus Formimonas warabiya]|uniref:Radical SAM protein n=1 Tax=Formimonas warabiya TaxID=1761012 RepID=A0A3G1KTU9_FORW1|nr:radical SAM protein [Candidatus Formimonas warabiya]ATW25834.1 radical SAM protein [Candidatus Formimonas warabiya]
MSDFAVQKAEKVSRQSPDYAQTSLASSLTLGFQEGLFYRDVVLKCLNLLVTYDQKCGAKCSYCGLAGNRDLTGRGKTFIRVSWPVYALADIIEAVKTKKHGLNRVCVGMVTHGKAGEDTISMIRLLKKETGLSISALVSPTVLKENDLLRIKEAGADRCGIAIDCATEALFEKYRGKGVGGPHSWVNYWNTLEQAIQVFGRYQAGVHLVVGLGETEYEMVSTIQKADDLGAGTHLFSFYPEPGSKMESWPQPDLGHYRRMQLARHLINEKLGNIREMKFNDKGQIIDFGRDITGCLKDGRAFITSGCPGKDGTVACNRPYGNERPSQPMRNFPFDPDAHDLKMIEDQLWDGIEV